MHPHTVLIVDDDPAIVSGVTSLLAQGGYRALSAATGAAALALLTPDVPLDLIILDVMLPDTDGYALCQRIRTLPRYVPILMLSARDETLDKVTGLDVGADDYLTKPFEPSELLARVRALLRFAAQRGGDQPLVFGALHLDSTTRTATLNQVPLELTPIEWAVLEVLMQEPGQVFGRETLFTRAWGADFLGDSRAVDACIQRLRAKLAVLEPTFAAIETVRGFGYRLGAP